MALAKIVDMMKGRLYLLVSALLIGLFATVVFSTTVVMVHHSPVNMAEDVTLENATLPDLTGDNSSYGLTFGEKDQLVGEQVSGILPPYLITPAIPIGIVYFILTLVFGMERISESFRSPGKATGLFIAFVFLHGIITLGMFGFVDRIYYISNNTDYITAPMRVMYEAIVNTKLLIMLLILQGTVLATVLTLWTHPLVPKYSDISRLRRYDSDLLKLNIRKWRQYGTWLSTVFGGVLLTGALVFITDASPYGGIFLTHALILVGGGTALSLGYIAYRIHRIETVLVDM